MSTLTSMHNLRAKYSRTGGLLHRYQGLFTRSKSKLKDLQGDYESMHASVFGSGSDSLMSQIGSMQLEMEGTESYKTAMTARKTYEEAASGYMKEHKTLTGEYRTAFESAYGVQDWEQGERTYEGGEYASLTSQYNEAFGLMTSAKGEAIDEYKEAYESVYGEQDWDVSERTQTGGEYQKLVDKYKTDYTTRHTAAVTEYKTAFESAYGEQDWESDERTYTGGEVGTLQETIKTRQKDIQSALEWEDAFYNEDSPTYDPTRGTAWKSSDLPQAYKDIFQARLDWREAQSHFRLAWFGDQEGALDLGRWTAPTDEESMGKFEDEKNQLRGEFESGEIDGFTYMHRLNRLEPEKTEWEKTGGGRGSIFTDIELSGAFENLEWKHSIQELAGEKDWPTYGPIMFKQQYENYYLKEREKFFGTYNTETKQYEGGAMGAWNKWLTEMNTWEGAYQSIVDKYDIEGLGGAIGDVSFDQSGFDEDLASIMSMYDLEGKRSAIETAGAEYGVSGIKSKIEGLSEKWGLEAKAEALGGLEAKYDVSGKQKAYTTAASAPELKGYQTRLSELSARVKAHSSMGYMGNKPTLSQYQADIAAEEASMGESFAMVQRYGGSIEYLENQQAQMQSLLSQTQEQRKSGTRQSARRRSFLTSRSAYA